MVATLIRLRWRLTLNALTRNVWMMIGAVLGGLYGLSCLSLVVAGAVGLSQVPVPIAARTVAGLGALTVLGWTVIPILVTGVDSTLDPRAMAAWTAPSPELARGLAVAAATGVPGVITGLCLLLPAMTWAVGGQWAAAILAVALAPVGLATCVLLSRVVVIGLGVTRSRRGRDLAAMLTLLLIMSLSLLPSALNFVAGSLADGGQDPLAMVGRAGEIAGLSPFGWALAAPGHLAQGRLAAAALLTAAAVALPAVLLPVWRAVVTRVMTGPVREGRRTRAYAAEVTGGDGRAVALALPWHRRLSRVLPSPAAAVAARCLRYWRSDPRYLGQAVMQVLMAIMVIVVMGVTSSRTRIYINGEPVHSAAPHLVMGAIVLMSVVMAWSLHDDLAFDSTAWWQHVTAGLRGRDDRLGRVVAAALWQLPTIIVMGVAAAAWTGRWDQLPAVEGLSLALYGAAMAWSAVMSAVMPYETNSPDDSVMKSRSSGMILLATLIQLVGLAGVGLLGAPIVGGFVAVAVTGAWGWGWLLLVLAVAWGAALIGAGIVLGGRALDDRAVRILATIRSWPGHELKS